MEPIDLSIAKKMVDNYSATRKTLIDKVHNINDTQSIWISLDKLKAFVDNLPEYATGVRIHLAAYDQSNQHYPNQTTIIMMGTVGEGDDHTDAIEKDVALLTADKPSTVDKPLGPFNQGKACPPNCG